MNRIVAIASVLAVLSAVGCTMQAQDESGAAVEGNDTKLNEVDSNYRRTVVYIFGETTPGQDMFVRGGLDYGMAKKNLGYDCVKTPSLCSIPIRHRSSKNPTTAGWKQGDTLLDWSGAEAKQGLSASKVVAQGSPLDWTTNYWPSDWGTEKTIEHDGYGVDGMNQMGMHEWKLDVDMDCSKAFPDSAGNRWFEVKSYISNGPGWETDAHQAGSPYASNNHFAQCGKINVFARGYDISQIYTFEMPKSISCAGGTLNLKPSDSGSWEMAMTDQKAIDYLVAESQSSFDFFESSSNCGAPFHTMITKHFPGNVQVNGQGSARTLVTTGLYTYNNGLSFASGQYGVQVDPSGTGLKVTINGLEMPCSHSAAGYEVGNWIFPNCVAKF